MDSLVARQLVTHYGDSIGFYRVYPALRDSLDSLDATVAGIRSIAARRIFITYRIAARELSYLYWNGHDNYPAFGNVLAEYIRAKASVEQRIIYWRKETAGMRCP